MMRRLVGVKCWGVLWIGILFLYGAKARDGIEPPTPAFSGPREKARTRDYGAFSAV
jgi:hypothetical protein